jgi:hypothetical protein
LKIQKSPWGRSRLEAKYRDQRRYCPGLQPIQWHTQSLCDFQYPSRATGRSSKSGASRRIRPGYMIGPQDPLPTDSKLILLCKSYPRYEARYTHATATLLCVQHSFRNIGREFKPSSTGYPDTLIHPAHSGVFCTPVSRRAYTSTWRSSGSPAETTVAVALVERT